MVPALVGLCERPTGQGIFNLCTSRDIERAATIILYCSKTGNIKHFAKQIGEKTQGTELRGKIRVYTLL